MPTDVCTEVERKLRSMKDSVPPVVGHAGPRYVDLIDLNGTFELPLGDSSPLKNVE